METVFIMGNEYIEFQGKQLWAFLARSGQGFSDMVRPERRSDRTRKYDDRITGFFWKNGDHTQVYSILEVEAPDLNLFQGLVKKQTIKGIQEFITEAKIWKNERKTYDKLVDHWKNSEANTSKINLTDYTNFDSAEPETEYELCLKKDEQVQNETVVSGTTGFWSSIKNAIKSQTTKEKEEVLELDNENGVNLNSVKNLLFDQEED